MRRWSGLFLLATLFLTAYCHAQGTPNVTLTGKIQGPNGLPASNTILSFTPSQQFFVAGQGAICSSYVIQFTGAPVVCADILNFNSTNPAAPPNGLNVQWSVVRQGTTNNISAAIVGDGNPTDFLNGTGAWSTPADGGGGSCATAISSVVNGSGFFTTTVTATVTSSLNCGIGELVTVTGASTYNGIFTLTGVSTGQLTWIDSALVSSEPAVMTGFVAAGSIIPPGTAGQVAVMTPTATGYAPQTKQMVDSADALGVVADGSTDVCTTFQAWIDANPGKHLWVRSTAAPTRGGATASIPSYYSSCTFHLKYNGTILDGQNPDDWQGAPMFLFAAGVTGFQIDPSCLGCAIENIEVAGGGKPYASGLACYNSNNALAYPFVGAADGILVYGGNPTIEHSQIECFNRDGIHIDGTNVNIGGYVGQPDFWKVNYGGASGNQAHDLYIHGGDTGDGKETLFSTYNSGGFGVQDDCTSSCAHYNTGTQGDGRDAGIAAKASSSISSISCAGTICSIVAASPVASIQNGIWVVIAGTTNYNGVYYVTGYTDTAHFSFTWVNSGYSTETSGTVGVDGSTHMFANATRTINDGACSTGASSTTFTSQSAQFGKDTQVGAAINIAGAGPAGALLSTTIAAVVNEYTATITAGCSTTVANAQASYTGGISHGPIMANGNSTWFTPYWESNQPKAKMKGTTLVQGGNLSIDYSYGIPLNLQSISGGSGVATTQLLEVVDPIDSGGGLQVQCGATAGQDCGLDIFNYNQSTHWKLYATQASGNGTFWIRDLAAGGAIPFAANHGSTTDITAATDVTLNPGSGHSIKLNGPIPVGTFTGVPWYDITSGAVCDGVTNAHVALQANLTAAAGGFAYIPALKQCETSVTLTLPTALQGFWIGPGAQLQASVTITGHGVIEQGGIGQRSTNTEVYGGGIVDANGKADDVAWFHNFAGLRVHDITLKGSNVNGLVLGDSAASFSDNAWVHHTWIDRPGAVSIPSGSSGILMNNIGDTEAIDNNTIISYDQGITVNGTNNWFAHNHCWARLTMTECFVDNGTGNHWESNEADSPGTYGFRIGNSAANTFLTGNTTYNNSSAPDNVLIGIYFANATPTATVVNNFTYGYSSGHRIATDISASSFTNINLCGNQDLNVVTNNSTGCGAGGGPGTGTTYAGSYWASGTTLGSSQDITVPAGASSTVVQNILTAAVAGQKIRFTGTYTACSLTLSVANVSLIGLNADGAVIQCATAGVPVLTISGAGDSIDSINLKHITNSPTCPGGNGTSTCGDGLQIAGGATRVKVSNLHANFNYNGIALGYTTYSELSNSISEFNNNHGVVFVMDATHKNMQWQVSRVLSEQNLGNGFDMTCPASFTSVQTPGPYITGWSAAYGNVGYGFNFSCSAATTSGIADVFIGNTFASANNNSGFRFDLGPNGGRNLIMTGGYSEQSGLYTGTAGFSSASQSATNVGYGVDITSSCDNTPPPNITAMTLWGNSYAGLHAACAGTSLTALTSYGNGAAAASAQTESGVEIDATNVQVNGGYARKGSVQNYGVYVYSGDTPSIVGVVCDPGITASNCIYSGTAPSSGYQQRIGQTTLITTGSTNALTANGFVSGGTTFSSSGGLSETTLTGGATSGKFTTVGVTSGSTIVTMGSSATAPTGWACSALDITHPNDVITASPTSTTTITLTVASAITAGDVIQFGPCIAY